MSADRSRRVNGTVPAFALALALALALLLSVASAQSLPEQLGAMIAPYRDSLADQMSEVLAISPVEMRTGNPEGLLGALAADLVLERARLEQAPYGREVGACVLNNGGLRIPLPRGPVTVGHLYEVMPFDNGIVILKLTSPQVQALADQIAAAGGEPVAGLTFQIRGDRALNVGVQDHIPGDTTLVVPGDTTLVVPGDTTLVATSSYLFERGGQMPALWEPAAPPIDTGVAIRDALIDGIRRRGAEMETLQVPELGRIRRAGAGGGGR